MKAIELMQRLGELVTEYGDVEVKVEQERDAAGWESSPISMIVFTKEDAHPYDGKIVIQGAS
ncbi:hypothetical protein KAR91_86305 [Candidatus Pacearchaeota archaeon]|nr:hypothetical protein [Candidatus Pacearchaeota archaeon]